MTADGAINVADLTGTFGLATSAIGTGMTYQWLRNGGALNGENGPILLRQNVNANDAGQYSVRLTGGGSTVTTSAATVTLNGGSADASTLALLDPGSDTMQITAGSGTASGEALVEI